MTFSTDEYAASDGLVLKRLEISCTVFVL